MAESHVVHALKEKRARLAGDLKAAQGRVVQIRADLASVDACLRMFRGDLDPEQITPKATFGKNPVAVPKGSGGRYALDVLRETGGTFTCQELATQVLMRLGKEPTPEAVAMLGKTIHSTFSRSRRGMVQYDRSTWPGKWTLARAEL
jgi:hypothetical protein